MTEMTDVVCIDDDDKPFSELFSASRSRSHSKSRCSAALSSESKKRTALTAPDSVRAAKRGQSSSLSDASRQQPSQSLSGGSKKRSSEGIAGTGKSLPAHKRSCPNSPSSEQPTDDVLASSPTAPTASGDSIEQSATAHGPPHRPKGAVPSTKQCLEFIKGRCDRGDYCTFSHTYDAVGGYKGAGAEHTEQDLPKPLPRQLEPRARAHVGIRPNFKPRGRALPAVPLYYPPTGQWSQPWGGVQSEIHVVSMANSVPVDQPRIDEVRPGMCVWSYRCKWEMKQPGSCRFVHTAEEMRHFRLKREGIVKEKACACPFWMLGRCRRGSHCWRSHPVGTQGIHY